MEDSPRLSPVEPMMVARRLSALREALGLKRAEMADMIGLDRSSYTKVENGSKPLLPAYAFRLYELYGVDMNYVYLGQPGGLPAHLSSKVTTHLRGAKQ